MAESCYSRCRLEPEGLAELECLVTKLVEQEELVVVVAEVGCLVAKSAEVAELECLVAKLVEQEELVEAVGAA